MKEGGVRELLLDSTQSARKSGKCPKITLITGKIVDLATHCSNVPVSELVRCLSNVITIDSIPVLRSYMAKTYHTYYLFETQ